MDRKKKQVITISILVMIVIIITVTAVIVKELTPSKEIMKLEDYYKVADEEILIFLENGQHKQNGLLIDDMVYVDYETVVSLFNKRFYWDSNENILIYTTPTEIIKADLGKKHYLMNNSKKTTPYQIVKTVGEQVFLAIDYVKEFSNLEYEKYTNPNRIVISCQWGSEFQYNKSKKESQIRFEPNIKSPILKKLEPGEQVVYMETEEELPKGFRKVMSEDGVIGYMKEKQLGEPFQETMKNDYKEAEYTHITKDYTINLVWHQVFNMDANNMALSKLTSTKGVNTISPTWFSLLNSEGDMSSLASETYVQSMKSMGIEVWALCENVNNEKDINMFELLSHTTRREKVMNELIASAIKYDFAGINIDFELISEKAAPHYIQFLRELSVKCRNNGIILSVDNPIPASFNQHYDLEEQGVIADYVVIMAYDEHYSGSEESGSVASIGFVEKAVNDTIEMVPAEKVVIGIPFYTRVWKENESDGKVIDSEAYGMGNAIDFLKRNETEPVWDEETGQYYGEFTTQNTRYRVWLEEEKSIEKKMKVITENKVAGVGGWKLGLEKEGIWNVIVKYTN